MTSKPFEIPWTKCASCGVTSHQTDWRPPPGYDQILQEFRCTFGHKTYTAEKEETSWTTYETRTLE